MVCNRRPKGKEGKHDIALEKVNWSTGKRGRVAEALVDEAMSSEESCTEESPDGKIKVTAYTRRRLVWESERFERVKKSLDTAYNKQLSTRATDRILPRRESEHPSDRSPPEDFPEWAIQVSD